MIARECPKTGRGGSTPPEWQERVADILAHGVDAVDIYFDSREIREEMLAGDRCERGSERGRRNMFDVERPGGLPHIGVNHEHMAHARRISECDSLGHQEPEDEGRLKVEAFRHKHITPALQEGDGGRVGRADAFLLLGANFFGRGYGAVDAGVRNMEPCTRAN
jgi:hypothetical protein